MFHGNRACSYETVARKFRPSVAFEWPYFLQTATIVTTDAQRWRVVRTSVVGIKAAAIRLAEPLISPEGQYEVISPGKPYRANSEGVKNVPLNISNLSAWVQRRNAYANASVMMLWHLSHDCKLALVEIQGKHGRLTEFPRGPRHFENHPLQNQPCSCTMEPWTPHTANTNDLLRRKAVGVLDWPSRSSDLNLIKNFSCIIKG